MPMPLLPPMSRAEVDRALGELGTAHDRASAAMYALDTRPELALLRGAGLTGETARVAAGVLARTGALWSQFAAFTGALDRAREVRARRSRPGDAELRELAELLRAPVVALDAEGTVLDDPAAGQPAHRVGLVELARRIDAEVAELAGSLAELEAARTRLAEWFGRLTDALGRLRPDVVSLDGAAPTVPVEFGAAGLVVGAGGAVPGGGSGDAGAVGARSGGGVDSGGLPGPLPSLAGELDRLGEAVEEAYRGVLTDPLAATGNGPAATRVRDRLRQFDAEAAALADRLAELTELRDGYPGRVRRLTAELDELASAVTETVRVHALALAKIANSALPEVSDPAPALHTQLTQLDQLHREHRWAQLGAELVAVEHGVATARRRMAELHEAADGLLRRRAELRGRLDAYRAKAGRLGLIEHVELSARYRQARDLLYTSPCDLSAATRAVVAYQRHLNDLAERPSPGRREP